MRDRRGLAPRRGDLRDALQLGLGFDVETENAIVERQRDFALGLADAGKSDALAGNLRRLGAAQFAFRNDVHAGAETGEQGQHGLVRIGLHRIADERVEIAHRLRKDGEMAADRRGAVAIERAFRRFSPVPAKRRLRHGARRPYSRKSACRTLKQEVEGRRRLTRAGLEGVVVDPLRQFLVRIGRRALIGRRGRGLLGLLFDGGVERNGKAAPSAAFEQQRARQGGREQRRLEKNCDRSKSRTPE